MGDRVPTGIGREIGRRIRHQRHLRGLGLHHQLYKLLRRVSLDVVFGRNHRYQIEHIPARNMPLVRTRMYGNPLGPETLAVCRHADHIGHIAPPGVAQGGYLVDVYA